MSQDDLVVDMVAIGFSEPPLRAQRAFVYVNGERIDLLFVDPHDFQHYGFRVPAATARRRRPLAIQFILPDAHLTPLDPRPLGIAVQSVDVRSAPP